MALERKHEWWLTAAAFVLFLGLEVFFGIESRLAGVVILAGAFVFVVVSRHVRK